MRSLRFCLIALFTFLLITCNAFLKKAIALTLCTILGFESFNIHPTFLENSKAIAITPQKSSLIAQDIFRGEHSIPPSSNSESIDIFNQQTTDLEDYRTDIFISPQSSEDISIVHQDWGYQIIYIDEDKKYTANILLSENIISLDSMSIIFMADNSVSSGIYNVEFFQPIGTGFKMTGSDGTLFFRNIDNIQVFEFMHTDGVSNRWEILASEKQDYILSGKNYNAEFIDYQKIFKIAQISTSHDPARNILRPIVSKLGTFAEKIGDAFGFATELDGNLQDFQRDFLKKMGDGITDFFQDIAKGVDEQLNQDQTDIANNSEEQNRNPNRENRADQNQDIWENGQNSESGEMHRNSHNNDWQASQNSDNSPTSNNSEQNNSDDRTRNLNRESQSSGQNSVRDGDLYKGTSYGDPHMITYDGYRYSFQTLGEYILTKSVGGDFEVQTRQTQVPGRQLSLNTAAAIKLGGDCVSFYVQHFPDNATDTTLRINGDPTTIDENDALKLSSGTIHRQYGNNYQVETTSGEYVDIREISMVGLQFMNVTPHVHSDPPGQFTGLLGDLDGDPANDLRSRGGSVIPSRSTYGNVRQMVTSFVPIPGIIPLNRLENAIFDQIYKDFGNSWRVDSAESLFDYRTGEGPATFADFSFPRTYRSLENLTPEQMQEAEAVCVDAGVEPELLDGCVFDVAFTEETGFAQAAANALLDEVGDRILNEVQHRVPIPIPRLPF